MRAGAALAFCLAAAGCSLLRDSAPPLSPAEAAAAGCYASATGWFHFGIDPMAGDTAERSWLVLQPVRKGDGTLAARFVGAPGVDASTGEHWDGSTAGLPRVGDTDSPARWRVQGDTIHVVWGVEADGLRLRAKLEKDGLRGWGTNPTGRLSRNDAGVWVPVECDWEMRAVRVPCEQVPRRTG